MNATHDTVLQDSVAVGRFAPTPKDPTAASVLKALQEALKPSVKVKLI